MKKALIFSLVFMLAAANMSAVLAAPISTGLTRDTSGGAAPIVKAKWEANADRYTDDKTTAGAQFNPSGQYGVVKTVSICAIVTDPDGLADITTAPGAVYGDVFYPEGIELGDSHVALKGQSGLGCGELMQEDKLTKLSKADGIELFCTNVRNNNNNLPTFAQDYNYDEICAETGELWKETAAVYCTTKDLSYEDPSGVYKVWAVAQDKVGLQGQLENTFTYLPLTAFETDFTSIAYGPVKLATEKIISGDLTWGNSVASVRNVGNTRLQMKVVQDDMGFGQTDGLYNVAYKARVGSSATWAGYAPFAAARVLVDQLDLSELDEMDFSIIVSKFPPTHVGDIYTGNMTLSAVATAHLQCAPKVGAKLSAYVAPTTCNTIVAVGDSIQAALNAATAGQTVCVTTGTHNTPDIYPLTINTAGVTLAGLGNAGDAILSGGVNINANNVKVSGLTIHDSSITGETFGVYLNAGVLNAIVSYNKLIGPGVATGSGLINVTNSGVAGLIFTNNESTNWLRGIFLNPSSNMTVEYNTLTGNGVGSANDNPSGNIIRRNQITGNSLEGIGTFLGATDSITVNENNIYGNGGVANELNNYAAFAVSAENNWWGDLTPADEIGNVGAAIVDFTPFANSAYALN